MDAMVGFYLLHGNRHSQWDFQGPPRTWHSQFWNPGKDIGIDMGRKLTIRGSHTIPKSLGILDWEWDWGIVWGPMSLGIPENPWRMPSRGVIRQL